MSRALFWGGLAGISAVVLLGAWFLQNFERVEGIEHSGYSIEARRDPLLAARRMLERMGVPVADLAPADWRTALEQGDATVVLLSAGWTLGEAARERLHDWVARGGRLVVVARAPAGGEDGPGENSDGEDSDGEGSAAAATLLPWLGVEAFSPSDVEPRRMLSSSARVELPGDAVQVRFATDVRLRPAPDAPYRILGHDAHGACVLRRALGAGQVTVLCSFNPWRNAVIGTPGHASVLWWLAGGRAGIGRPLWFVLDADMPPLHLWLWQRAPQVIGAVALAALVWLWSLARRAGPLRDLQPPQRRRTVEHIEASGRLAWQLGDGAALLTSMRQAFHGDLERRRPAWARLAPQRRTERLAQAAGLSVGQVEQATRGPATERGDFAEAVRLLQQIWRSL